MGFLRQFLFLLKLILRLKGFRFLVAAFTITTVVSNTYIYTAVESVVGASREAYLGLKSYGADEFVAGSKVLLNLHSPQAQALQDIVSSRTKASYNWFSGCETPEDCSSKYLQALHSNLGSTLQDSVNFNDSDFRTATVRCLLSGDSTFGCPYLVYLVTQSLARNASADYIFKDVRLLSLVSQVKSSSYAAALEASAPPASSSAPNSVCTKNPTLYGMLFPIVLMIQMILVTFGLVVYVTFGNLLSISRLKKDNFLQLMFQNGMSVSAYWTATWFITILEMAVFAAVFVLALGLQCPGYYPAGSLLISFVSLFLYGIFLSALSYLLSSLISSYFIVLLIMIVAFLIHLTFILANRLILNANSSYFVIRDISLIFPYGHIAELLGRVLVNQVALSGYYLAIFILGFIVPALLIPLGLYLDFLFRNGNGFCLPPSFLFKPQFWRPSVAPHAEMLQVRDLPNPRPNIEPVEEGLRPRISVSDVVKTYQKRDYPCSALQYAVALSRVSCTIYDGQITALIGHNGAGKTTLLKVLIGDENTTSGTAVIDQWQVTDPLQRLSLRGKIGICHQTNVLCSELRVRECIELVLMSRGSTTVSRQAEVSDLLSRLDLDDKVNVRATELSGGQMRKLCTLLALIGDPKVIFLDEPTSGLDPVSRRRLWQILQEYKVGRAVILCTQFMDEADILADRKIFLSSGALICAGSSLFLKHAFGCGYVLNVSLKSEGLVQELLEQVRAICPSARLSNQFRTEVELALPSSEAASMPTIVRLLEDQKTLVDAFGLSQATLDDIFMRLKDVKLTEIEAAFQSGQLSSFAEHKASANREGQEELQKLLSSESAKATTATAPQQFSALMKMNLTRLKREKLKLCCRFIFPIILLVSLVGSLFLERNLSIGLPMASNISTGYSFSAGICVQDTEDPFNVTFAVCGSAFGLSYPSQKFDVLRKNRSTDLSQFLLSDSALLIFNATCRYTYRCPMLYSSSWNLSDVNRNREVQMGFFQTSQQNSLATSSAVGDMISLYASVAGFFNSSSVKDLVHPIGYTSYPFFFTFSMGLFIFIFLYSIIPVTYISDPLEDKETKVRYHLASMGLSGFGYWLNTLVLHWCQYAAFVVVAAIAHAAVVTDTYGNALFLAGVMLPCLFLGCASNQLSAYAIGSVLKKPNPLITVLYFFLVMLLSQFIMLIQLSPEASLFFIWAIPTFAPMALASFGLKVAKFALAYYNIQRIADIPNLTSVYFTHPFVQHALSAMVVHIVLMIIFIALLENRSHVGSFCCRLLSRSNEPQALLNHSTDSGVKQEAQRIARASRSRENVLEVNGLEKQYGNGVKAVKGVTFGSLAGEIFGLLGPNGAGKTTTLSIVVGEEVASSGTCEVHFLDEWMSGRSGAVGGAVGYCPQHNPLFENVTVMEHLEFYARIRGVPSVLAARQIPNLVSGLGLVEHKQKQANQLSGGNKRRLCLAISLLGNPTLVVIDEASTGVDPEAKRFIWSAIRGMANSQRSVVVTTHSMEEVEALCSRVGIMNHGLMIAFGTIQQLRSRYGNAYTLDILLSASHQEERSQVRERLQRAVGAILSEFPQSKVVEELHNRVQFLLPEESVACLSDALAWLTNHQGELGIQYLTLYQMSLDQVFVRLVKDQEEVKGENNETFNADITGL